MTVKLTLNTKPTPEQRPTIYFDDGALSQIHALVKECNIEIAWHMTVIYDKLENTYIVEDVFPYPQIATATFVESDDDRYNTWLQELDDETFNKLRGQGHSHVKMGVHPSGIDYDLYSRFTAQVKDFYLFIIVNKMGAMELLLYDIPKNLVYFTEDLNIVTGAEAWARDIISYYVKRREPINHGPKEELRLLQAGGSY